MPLDNIDIAILTRLNNLTERYGLKPYDFVATVKSVKGGNTSLEFETPVDGNALREERFDKMLKSLGVEHSDDHGMSLVGTPDRIVDALDDALAHAPQSRKRF